MPKFVHIDIPADDPEREASFFREVFKDPDGNVFSILEPVSGGTSAVPLATAVSSAP